MDGIKAALLGALLSGGNENLADQDKYKSQLKTYDNANEALDYARRLAQLHPGDRIQVLSKDNFGYQDAIFIQMTDTAAIEYLWYDPEDKRIWAGKTNLFAVRLP